jgi:hypothetical protein
VTDGQTPHFLNPKSVTLYDGLYLVGPCHTAGTPEDKKPWCFFELLA